MREKEGKKQGSKGAIRRSKRLVYRHDPHPSSSPFSLSPPTHTPTPPSSHPRDQIEPPPPPPKALRSRSEGAALPLKQYHNSIKRELINAFSGGPGASLLDLACGRGGDVWKWMDAGLSYVLGVDLSPGEVAEAARRFEEARAKRGAAARGGGGGGGGGGGRGRGRGGGRGGGEQLVAEFRECATLGLEPFSAEPPPPPPPLVPSSGGGVPPPGGDGEGGGEREELGKERRGRGRRRRRRRRFDSVSCMFAAHYFCSSDAALSTFLSNVARNLRPVRRFAAVVGFRSFSSDSFFPFWGFTSLHFEKKNSKKKLAQGGFFFGTVPSGKKVMAAIKEGGRWPLLATPMLRLEAQWKGPPQPFGCGYTCAIGNTVTSAAVAAAAAAAAPGKEEEEEKGGEAAAAAGGGGGTQENKRRTAKDDEATEQGSFEYLVFASAFSAIAARHGLSPFPQWSSAGGNGTGGNGEAAAAATAAERLLDPADEGSHFKSFAPHFPGSDPSLERASELFQAFVFVKNADAEGEGEDGDFVEEEEEEKEEEEEEAEDEGGKTKRRKL